MKKKHGFIIVYSITDDASFGHLKPFYDLIFDEYVNTEEEGAEVKPPPIVLVGNKLDLASERKVPTAQGQALAAQWGAGFFEVRCVPARNGAISKSSFAVPRRTRTSRMLFTR